VSWRSASWRDRARALIALAVIAVAAWLDRDGCVLAQHAGVFAAIWAAISAVGELLGAAGGAIATSLETVVAWLITQVGWLAARVASILASTGGMFARVWDWSRQLWSNVLKPSLIWLKDKFDQVRGWLRTKFGPVFDFLHTVRRHLLDIYKQFIRPVLDAIDVARGFLRVLEDLGVQWARKLDQALGEIEQVITENFLRVLGEVNKVINVLNAVVDGSLLFKRFAFLATLRRDVVPAARIFTNARTRPLTDDEAYRSFRGTETAPIPAIANDAGAYWAQEGADVGHVIDDAMNRARDYYTQEYTAKALASTDGQATV
jgi:hypothetical protein